MPVAAAPIAHVAPVARPMGPRPTPPERLKVLRQRRRRRRTLIAGTFLTTVCTFVTGVGYLYVQSRLDQIQRISLGNLTAEDSGAPMNLLLVGSDSRAGLDGAEAAGLGKGQVEGQRSDTIMLLHVDPQEGTAAIVSIPRDLYVPIAATGTPDRINAAFALGGADQLIATIQSGLGVTINHYVEVEFSGFKEIVDAIGGVTLYIPYPVRDPVSGLSIDRTGCVAVDGDQGLAWVRSRQTQFFVNGAWQVDGRGDLGRIERQQEFVRRMMKKALAAGLGNPIQLNRLIGVAARDVTFDATLSTDDLSVLGRRFRSLDPEKVALRTLPTSPVNINGKAVLLLQLAQAQPIIDLLNGKAPAQAPPSTVPAGPPVTTGAPSTGLKPADVRIRILNGVGTPGAASKAGTSLTGIGFSVADKGDAPAISPKTMIMYATGQLAKAQLLQSSLVAGAGLKEDASIKAVDVNLVVGADFAGAKAGISSGTSSVPTTVAPTTVAPTTTVAQINPVPLPKGTSTPPC